MIIRPGKVWEFALEVADYFQILEKYKYIKIC